jgi:hypothetical protein
MGYPQRIQRVAVKGWRLPPNTVYVGRGSKWGNPFPFDHQRYLGKTWAVEAYAQWLTTTLKGMTLLREHLHELKGRSLACWEKPDEPSHADLLLALANEELAADTTKMSHAAAAALAIVERYEKAAAAPRS